MDSGGLLVYITIWGKMLGQTLTYGVGSKSLILACDCRPSKL